MNANTNTARIARFVAMPVVLAGIAGGALLGLAGPASASAVPTSHSGIVAMPQTKAQPATDATPGGWWHRHHPSLLDSTSAANFATPGA
jgi:hypothetical protein